MENIKLVPKEEIGAVSSSHGFGYDAKVTLFTALTAALTFDDFEINTNVVNFQPLDDIVLKGYKNGEETLYLIQLKHVAKLARLEDYFFINKIQRKSKFDLIRYNNKYIELSKKLNTNNINFIFYTNYELDVNSTLFLKNDNLDDMLINSLNTSARQESFLLKNSDKLTFLNDHFINNTYFLTNQQNVDNFDNSILNLLIKFQISKDLSELIISNLFHYFDTIYSETENKPVITKSLTLKLIYFSCLYCRNIPIFKLPNINSHSLYSPYLWDYLKKNKVIIKTEYVESIQNMIFNHDDSIQSYNPIFMNLLFKHKKFEFKQIVKQYFVQCCCGSLPFLIEYQYYQEIIPIVNTFKTFEVIFIDSNSDKYIESKFRGVSSEFCEEIFKIKIRPLNRNECLIEDIFENKDELKLMLNNVNISDFLKICGGDKFEDNRESFELMRFVYKLKVENLLNDMINNDVVVLINYNYLKSDLINNYKLNISEDLINFVDETGFLKLNVKIIVLNDVQYNKINIKLIKKAYENKNVHFLNIDHHNGSLFWVNTFGSLKNIIFAKTNNDTLILEELPIFFKFNQLIVFSGIPGIGKTIAMNQLSTFIPSNIYVLLIKLTEQQQILDNFTDDINCLELLNTLTTEKNGFYLNILELKFKHKDLCVIFDGYDEVAPTSIKKINNLINYILKEEIQVVLTSRTIFQNEIEEEFSTKSLILKPFDLQEQTQYLEQCFSQNSKLNKYDITNKCADIINKIENNLIGDIEFNSVPLHLKIICDILLDLFQQNNFDTTNIRIDKLTIFNTFIDKKIDIFKEKTKTLNFDDDEIKEYHQNFGLKQIFPHVVDISTQKYINRFSEKLKRGSEKIGHRLDDVNDTFIHRIIAEYFTASWLVDNCENNSLSKELFMNEIFKKGFYFIYYCCNSFLYRETSVYNKIISNNFNEITSDEINQKYPLNRNILHLVILNFDLNYKSNIISTNLEEFLKRISFESNNLITQKDYFQLTPFDYSEKLVQSTKLIITIKLLKNNFYFYFNQNFSFLEFLSCKNIKISNFPLKFENGFELFMFTINSINLIKFNFIFLKENYDKENNKRLINDHKIGFEWLIELGETINNLHYKAMDINSVQLSSFLLEKYNSNDFFININENPLSYAFSKNLFDFIKLFMENEAVAKNNYENIIYIINKFIQNIVINNNEQLIKYLSNNNFNFKEFKIYNQIKKDPEQLSIYINLLTQEKNDKLDNTMTNLIILSKNNKKYPPSESNITNLLNLLECVIELQNNINSENKNGETPLHLAIQNFDLDTIKILLKLKADVNFNNNLQNPYLHCSININSLNITKLLLENESINLEIKNFDGDTPLICAAKNKNLEILKLLISFNAKINVADNFKKSPLHWSIFGNELKITTFLLENDANIEAVDIDGNTPLIYAVQNENLDAVKILLNFGAKINTTNEKQESPLHWAVSKNELEIAKILLTNKADIAEALDINWDTPLMWAIRYKNLEAVKLLCSFKAKINTCNKNRESPLHWAILDKELDITIFLLENEAQIEADDIHGNTPLFWAVDNQNLGAVKILIEHGCQTNASNNHQETPLHRATSNKELEITRILLKNKAQIESIDINGNTPLFLAVSNQNLDAVEMLINSGCQINACNNFQESPLHWAVSKEELEITILLLKHKAKIEIVDINGCTPLISAVRNNNISAVNILLENGANLEAFDVNGNTSLIWAVCNQNLNAVEILLNSGAKINTSNKNQENALLKAVSKTELTITKILIEYKANIEAVDINGNTPLICAVINNNSETVKILLNFGANINATNRNSENLLNWEVPKDNLQIIKILLKNKPNIDIFQKTPLIYSIVNQNINVMKILIDSGAIINKSDYQSILHTLICKNNFDAIEMLINGGSTLNADEIFPIIWEIRSTNFDMFKFVINRIAIVNKFGRESLLHFLILKDRKEFIRFLIEKGEDVDSFDIRNNTPLMLAVQNKKNEIIELLVTLKANINKCNNDQIGPLHLAVKSNNLEITEYLLEHKADVDIFDCTYKTPLILAIENKNVDILTTLIKYKANINICGNPSTKYSPLFHAVFTKDAFDVAKILLENGASVNHTDAHGKTPLMWANLIENSEMVKILQQYNAI